MNGYTLREIKEEDLEKVTEIYNHYVQNTTATFHQYTLQPEEMKPLVFFDNAKYMAFVIIGKGDICGYCLLTQFKTREAYNHTAEITVYLDPNHVGKGIGSRAVKHIEDFANSKDIHVLVAVICGENDKSIKLFERNGYFKCAHYKEVGKKFGRLLDVVSYQKILLDKV